MNVHVTLRRRREGEYTEERGKEGCPYCLYRVAGFLKESELKLFRRVKRLGIKIHSYELSQQTYKTEKYARLRDGIYYHSFMELCEFFGGDH